MSEQKIDISAYQIADDSLISQLNQAGYNTIFDIISEGFTTFIKNNSGIDYENVKEIYQRAEQRIDNLQTLYRAWQLRNDPVLTNINKLAPQPEAPNLQDALSRSLGGDANFNDLFPERSKDGYADVTSIQSLFSPGRYLTSLYKIALTLHATANVLNITKRRPDLGAIVLSNNAMNDEVPSLDILLEVLLAPAASTLDSLEKAVYPINLPYSDSLQIIRSVLQDYQADLPLVWQILSDDVKSVFKSYSTADSARSASIQQFSTDAVLPVPVICELLAIAYGYYNILTSSTAAATLISTFYNLSATDAAAIATALNNSETFCQKTQLSFNQLLKLTAQRDYSNLPSSADAKLSAFKKYVKKDDIKTVPVTEYGAVFLTGAETTPLLLSKSTEDVPALNFTATSVLTLGLRAQQLIRLRYCTGLSFEQLDWMIINANKLTPSKAINIVLTSTTLQILAEYIHLNRKYAVDPDVYTTFIGDVNTYAESDHRSLFQKIFSSADGVISVALGSSANFIEDKQGQSSTIICGALGVTSNELARIAIYCGFQDTIKLSSDGAGKIYRIVAIPNMLGLTLAEAEKLWQLMANGKNDLLTTIGGSPSLKTLEIIRNTEAILEWMSDHQLDVLSLEALVTQQYSTIATAELFNFLHGVYQSTIGSIEVNNTRLDSAQSEKLYRSLAAGFNLKTNVMTQLTGWLTSYSASSTTDKFTLDAFWKEIETLFSDPVLFVDSNAIELLQKNAKLIRWSQMLSQLVLITQWANLSEQDIALLVNNPAWLIAGAKNTPAPTLYLLLVLSRFKEWQQRIVVSTDEAMRYFAKANVTTPAPVAKDLIAMLAINHDWQEQATTEMIGQLLEATPFPKNFEQLYLLESWMRLSQQLRVGSSTLSNMLKMRPEVASGEDVMKIPTLVANNLLASVRSTSLVEKE